MVCFENKMIELQGKKVLDEISLDFNLCSAERTVWSVKLCLDPLHHALIVEHMLAWCLSDDGVRLEVFHADRTTFLLVFVF